MAINLISLVRLSALMCLASCSSSSGGGKGGGAPHVFVALQARNCAYLLPNFFGYLESLDYPKDRISVW